MSFCFGDDTVVEVRGNDVITEDQPPPHKFEHPSRVITDLGNQQVRVSSRVPEVSTELQTIQLRWNVFGVIIDGCLSARIFFTYSAWKIYCDIWNSWSGGYWFISLSPSSIQRLETWSHFHIQYRLFVGKQTLITYWDKRFEQWFLLQKEMSFISPVFTSVSRRHSHTSRGYSSFHLIFFGDWHGHITKLFSWKSTFVVVYFV